MKITYYHLLAYTLEVSKLAGIDFVCAYKHVCSVRTRECTVLAARVQHALHYMCRV